MGYTRYTKELLEPLVTESTSIAEVLRCLGHKRISGGTHAHVSRRIRDFGIDTSHFLGQRHNKGKRSPYRKSWREILVKRGSGYRAKSLQLRRAMLDCGFEYRCVRCDNTGEWRGEKLRLEHNHKNKDPLDDRPENVEFLCPNCHTQEKGHNGRKD